MIKNAWYNCLFTLLNSLSWKGDKKILEEYISSYADVETPFDFKNLMASLGFITRSAKITFSVLHKKVFPCLFISKENKPYCILNYSDDVFLAYDGTEQQYFLLNSDVRKGTLLTFSPMDQSGESIYSSRPDWLALKVGLIAMIPAGGLILFLTALFIVYPLVKRQQSRSSSAQAERMDLASTLLDGFLDIQTAGMMKPWSAKFDDVSRKAAYSVLEESQVSSLIASISSFCVSIFNLFTINAMVYMVLEKNIETAVLIPSLMIVRRILGILRSSFIVLSQTDSVLNSIRQLQRFMAIPQEIRPVKFSIAARILPGNIIFSDVSFRYGNEGAPALYMSNFVLETGKIHLFTGMPGSGRTTAVKLIIALYKPQSGRIIMGRYNIHQMDVQQFRQKIMFSPSDPVLLHETIENFITGNSAIHYDRMIKIAKQTGLELEMKQYGFDFSSQITDEVQANNDLAQLISITRVLVHEAFVYIIDDPFFVNEEVYIPKLISAVKETAESGAIVIVVSNSPAFMSHADKRVNFVSGRTRVEVIKEI